VIDQISGRNFSLPAWSRTMSAAFLETLTCPGWWDCGEITTHAYVVFNPGARHSGGSDYEQSKYASNRIPCSVISTINKQSGNSPWVWTPAAPATEGMCRLRDKR